MSPSRLLSACLALLLGVASVSAAERTRALLLDFVPGHGAETQLGREAADAVALALMDNARFEVVPRSELEQEVKLRGWHFPLSDRQTQEVAEALRAGRLITGEVQVWTRRKPPALKLVLQTLVHQVELDLTVAGAQVVIEREATNEDLTAPAAFRLKVLNQAVEEALPGLLSERQTTGKVLLADGAGRIHLSIGARDGLKRGDRIALIRSQLDPKTARRKTWKIGEASIVAVGTADAEAVPLKGCGSPKPLDSILVLYQHPPLPK